MAQDVEAPEKVGGGTVDVGSPRPLERLPPAVGGTCRAQTSLGRNVSYSGGLALPQLLVQGAAMLSMSVKRWRKPGRLSRQPLIDRNLHPCCYQRRKTDTEKGRKAHGSRRWWGCGFRKNRGQSFKSGGGAPPAGHEAVLHLAEHGLSQAEEGGSDPESEHGPFQMQKANP